jgi:hypothetical protein
MARKSQSQRLSDAAHTLTLWEAAGHGQEKPALFINQMIQRMERGKYPSAGQRKWLDSLTDEGAAAFPVVHNQARLDEIDEAINTNAMQSVDVLRDFRFKIKKGWNLSEKQEGFLTSLLEQAQSLREFGLPRLTDEERHLVESLLRHGSQIGGRNDYYGYQQGKIGFVVEVRNFYNTHGTVTSRHIESLRKMFKGVTKALTEKKHQIGNLVPAAGRNGIVMSDAYIDNDGALVIDVMAAGKLRAVHYSSVGKRLLKNEGGENTFWDGK